jgi:formate-dependent nitrite reductase cytochrome c552 subunit
MLKKVLFVMLVALFAVGIASAQQLKGDILGPHNVNGHGCASCHAPHSGAVGNGGTNFMTGENTLWGRDFFPATYTGISGNTIAVTNTGAYAATDPAFHTAACMSCHDGNQTQVIGMTGNSVEVVEGKSVTTYLAKGNDGLKNDHPVDVPYDPTSSRNWPGTVDATTGNITWTVTPAVTMFQASYGRPFSLRAGTGTAGVGSYVECGTCHNPHSVNFSKGTYAGVANSVKPTNFFVRGWYNTDNPASNSGTQFCRSCHYSKSNEYVNWTVPTT